MITTLFLGGPLVPFFTDRKHAVVAVDHCLRGEDRIFPIFISLGSLVAPPLKYDQLMNLGWRKLLPVAC